MKQSPTQKLMATDMPHVDICLATYNGAVWLAEFLQSLERQTYKNWRLVVSDDGSTDYTLDLITSFFSATPDRLLVVKREQVGIGVIANFQDALAASTADYLFLADQDDIWLPTKLMDLYNTLRGVEGASRTPAAVYSDLVVVDQSLKLLAESWWGYSQVPSTWALSLKNLLVQNAVPGCALAFNRQLLEIALPVPAKAVMHDWWLLLVASAVGKVAYFKERPTVLYRRHQGAATYDESIGNHQFLVALKRFLLGGEALRESYKSSARQAAALLQRISTNTGAQAPVIELVRCYVSSMHAGWLERRRALYRYGIVKPSKKGTLRFYFWI